MIGGLQWQVMSSLRLGIMGHHVLIQLITLTVPLFTYILTEMFVVLDKKDIHKLKRNIDEKTFLQA